METEKIYNYKRNGKDVKIKRNYSAVRRFNSVKQEIINFLADNYKPDVSIKNLYDEFIEMTNSKATYSSFYGYLKNHEMDLLEISKKENLET